MLVSRLMKRTSRPRRSPYRADAVSADDAWQTGCYHSGNDRNLGVIVTHRCKLGASISRGRIRYQITRPSSSLYQINATPVGFPPITSFLLLQAAQCDYAASWQIAT